MGSSQSNTPPNASEFFKGDIDSVYITDYLRAVQKFYRWDKIVKIISNFAHFSISNPPSYADFERSVYERWEKFSQCSPDSKIQKALFLDGFDKKVSDSLHNCHLEITYNYSGSFTKRYIFHTVPILVNVFLVVEDKYLKLIMKN